MRGKRFPRRTIDPDPVFGNRLVAKLINRIMQGGKKTVAQKQIYHALELVQTQTKAEDPVELLRQVLETIKPNVEVRSRRVGGAAYQVPVPVKGDRKETLAIRWLVLAARKRSSAQYHTFAEKLAAELTDALKGEGEAIRKKETTHKMADANKAFAHFRW